MNQVEKPIVYQGEKFTDERGIISFVNDFDFHRVKRSYIIENSLTQPIRAFQCHQKEAKYVSVISGKALVVIVPLSATVPPSKAQQPQRYFLQATNPQVLYIPPFYANGLKSLEPNTKVIFFSTATLDESKNDSSRLPFDYWGEELWNEDAKT